MSEVEKLARQIRLENTCPLGEEQSCPYEPLLLSCDVCYEQRIVALIKEAGYLSVEPVQLEE